MEKVVVQTGAKTYQITDQDGNDLGVFRFIPSDAGILKRYKEAAAFFTGINERIKDKDFEEILLWLSRMLRVTAAFAMDYSSSLSALAR